MPLDRTQCKLNELSSSESSTYPQLAPDKISTYVNENAYQRSVRANQPARAIVRRMNDFFPLCRVDSPSNILHLAPTISTRLSAGHHLQCCASAARDIQTRARQCTVIARALVCHRRPRLFSSTSDVAPCEVTPPLLARRASTTTRLKGRRRGALVAGGTLAWFMERGSRPIEGTEVVELVLRG